MWRRPTKSGISFICILAPTRFFVKSIKINIARRGLKISSPASSFSPLSSFWQAKNSLLSLPHSSGNPGCSKKNARRGLKILPPASSPSPLPSFCLAKTCFSSFLTGSGKPGCSRHKKKRPSGRFFSLCKTKNYLNKLSTFCELWFA